MTWIKTENGGYSDTCQAVSWQKMLEWQETMYLYSCYLYYELDNPKLSDGAFDYIVTLLERNYNDLSDRIKAVAPKGTLKTEAHHIAHILTDDEKKEALVWRNE
jgi:NAD-dependent DNA ligase